MKKINGIRLIFKISGALAICILIRINVSGQDSTQYRGRSNEYRIQKANEDVIRAKSFESENKFADALRYYLSALFELETISDSTRIAAVKSNIGDIFYKNGMYQKAKSYYADAAEFFRKQHTDNTLLQLNLKIAQVEYKLNQFDQAALLANSVLTQAQKVNNKDLEQNARQLVFKSQVGANHWLAAKPTAMEILFGYKTQADTINWITSLNNLGYVQQKLGESDSALKVYFLVAKLEMESNGYVHPSTLVNQAIIYQNRGDDQKALDYINQASKAAKAEQDPQKLAEYLHLTALVYYTMKDNYNAGIYNEQSIEKAEESKNFVILRDALLLASEIKKALYDFEGAFDDYSKYLALRDSLAFENRVHQQELTQLEFRVERISYETQNVWADEEINYLDLQRLKLDSANRQKQLEILFQSDSIQKITIQNQRLENARAKQALLLKEEQIYAARKKKEVDSLQQVGKIQALQLEQQKLVQKEQQSRIDLLDRENQIKELNLRKVRTRNQFLVGFGVLALVILYLVYRGLRYQKRTNKILIKQNNEIERQRDEIEHQRQRSEKLLLNILPEETAEELKEKGSATPRQYQQVSVLFTDFKGFTNIAEKLTPEELVEELNQCFLAFDHIIDKYNLEKIKTIGDAYMCAGGIPVANTTNPMDTVKAGLEIRDYMENLKKHRENKGEKYWELRIGIHTGQVVAGVVGKNKFAYDIWGDAVNTASRMESSGIPGQVNISGSTYELVKHAFECKHRGKIAAKNKGEIDMYIVGKPL
ncbi:MAG: hypothetical protein KDC09_17100 [Bacteroidales bacterium]|nr:hypothetical protein [Bacteroidales bacterium]